MGKLVTSIECDDCSKDNDVIGTTYDEIVCSKDNEVVGKTNDDVVISMGDDTLTTIDEIVEAGTGAVTTGTMVGADEMVAVTDDGLGRRSVRKKSTRGPDYIHIYI